MKICKLTLLDEVNCKFEGLDPSIRQKMIRATEYVLPYAKFTPAGRIGRWDGKVQFMNLGGSTYFHMLDKLLPILDEANIDIELEDHRLNYGFEFEPIDENIFSDVVFGPGHHMEGKSIILREHQVNAVNSCLANPHGLVLAATGAGKAQPLDEPVLTINGWKRMGDIKVGDIVKCPDGTNAPVLGVYPQGIKPTVRMTFSDGRSVECCDEHLWNIYSIAGEKNPEKRWRNLSVKEIIELQNKQKRPVYIKTITGDIFEEKELPIHPYILGVLLGDGYLRNGNIMLSSSDEFVIDKVSSLLPDGYIIKKKQSSKYDYSIVMDDTKKKEYLCKNNKERYNELRVILEELGIYNKYSYEKFIPEIYKMSSIEQRLQLIQGLIDTDGYVDKRLKNGKSRNVVEFCSTSEKLVDDLKDIMNSLGGYGIKKSKQTYYTYAGVKQKGRPSFKMRIDYNNLNALASLPRKKDFLYSERNRVENKLKIEKIEYIEDKECQCIYIDHPEHLYITRDYIVTHNTIICAALAKSVQKYGRSVIIVPSTDLVQQTYDDYIMCGLDAGMFYGAQKDFGHQHTITTWQSFNSLWKKTKKGEIELTEQDVNDFIDGVVCVIVDECQGAGGDALVQVLSKVMNNVPLRWGLTGTIPKDPVVAAKIKCNVGDVIYKITAKELQDKKILSTCNVNCIKLKSSMKFASYAEELKYLVTDRDRMAYVASLISALSESGNTLVLVDRLEAGELLCEFLGIPKSEFVRGETKKKDRESSYGEIRWADNKILIATYGVASTGISISRLYNVVLIEPGKSFVRTIQSIGRGLRRAEDKDHVEIYDISGSNKYSAKHLRERLAYYKEAQYPHTVIDVKDWENTAG